MNLIAQGAEARIFEEDAIIIKERTPKGYRHPAIDTLLRESRTRREAKILTALKKIGFPSPNILTMNDKKGVLTMEHINGEKLSNQVSHDPIGFGSKIGMLLGKLHAADIVHGDPTTSNMIVNDEKEIILIDFGLSQFSKKIEDKAVDLHLLDRAIQSNHHDIHEAVITAAFDSYTTLYHSSTQVLERLEEVRKRGRNRRKGS